MKTSGDETCAGSPLGRRNKLHVPHEAAASVTMRTPDSTVWHSTSVSRRETFLREFHAERPGITSRALARSGCYERFAAQIPRGRILDLACGDGYLTRLLGPGAVGLDISPEPGPHVRARAQALPFAAGSFDAVACHLAFMLFDEVERVVAELSRVLRPGGAFHALLGGGPVADGHDAFHVFADTLPPGRGFGDRRASSEAGWRALFAGWSEPRFERWELDLSGSLDEVWTFLGASYQLADHDRARAAVRAAFPDDPVPLRVATFYASVTR